MGLQLRSFWDRQSVSGLCPDSLSLWTRSAFEPSWPWPLPPPQPAPLPPLFTTRRRCTNPSPRFIVRPRYHDGPPLESTSACFGVWHHRDHLGVEMLDRAKVSVSDGVVIKGSRYGRPSHGKHCTVDVYPKATCLIQDGQALLVDPVRLARSLAMGRVEAADDARRDAARRPTCRATGLQGNDAWDRLSPSDLLLAAFNVSLICWEVRYVRAGGVG